MLIKLDKENLIVMEGDVEKFSGPVIQVQQWFPLLDLSIEPPYQMLSIDTDTNIVVGFDKRQNAFPYVLWPASASIVSNINALITKKKEQEVIEQISTRTYPISIVDDTYDCPYLTEVIIL